MLFSSDKINLLNVRLSQLSSEVQDLARQLSSVQSEIRDDESPHDFDWRASRRRINDRATALEADVKRLFFIEDRTQRIEKELERIWDALREVGY